MGRRAGLVGVAIAGLLVAIQPAASASTRWAFGPVTDAIPFPAGGAVASPTSEPRMLLTEDGRILIGAQFEDYDCQPTPQVDGSAALPCVWASGDGGATFTEIGGGAQFSDDVDLAQTAQRTLVESFMSNLGLGNGVGGTSISRSFDGGRTWSNATSDKDVNDQAVNDRPFLLALPGGGLLLSYAAPPGNIFVSESSDQGATWGVPEAVSTAPPQLGLSVNGEPIYDPVRRETVLSYAYSDSVGRGLSLGSGYVNHVGIARRRNGSATWTLEPAVNLPTSGGILGLPSLTADGAGDEYLSFPAVVGPDGVGVFVTRSAADGSWSTPVRVDPPGGSAMLASVRAAGRRGVAVAYYGADDPAGRTASVPWSIRVAISRDGGGSFSNLEVSPRVAYVGSESTEQTHIYDLLAFVIDRQGLMDVAWTEDPFVDGALTDHNSILFARQVAGPPISAG